MTPPAPSGDNVWYDYAVIRVVPRVERGEFVNVGVVLYAAEADFLNIMMAPDERQAALLEPSLDAAAVRATLDALVRIVRGESLGGPIARLEKSERFGWVTAPRSTVVQPSAVHTGQCRSPAAALEELYTELVG